MKQKSKKGWQAKGEFARTYVLCTCKSIASNVWVLCNESYLEKMYFCFLACFERDLNFAFESKLHDRLSAPIESAGALMRRAEDMI
jgi:hypothetical protein